MYIIFTFYVKNIRATVQPEYYDIFIIYKLSIEIYLFIIFIFLV